MAMGDTGDHRAIRPVAPAGPRPRAVAQAILNGFDRHYALFRYSAQRAKTLFETAQWAGIAQLARERIAYYDSRVIECTRQLNRDLKGSDACPTPELAGLPLAPAQLAFWQTVKTEYIGLLAAHPQPECAETFFNSVSCRIVQRDYYNNDFLFVRPAVATEYIDHHRPSYRVYYPLTQGLQTCLHALVADFGLAAPFADLPAQARRVARMAVHHLRRQLDRGTEGRIAADCQIHVLGTLFFRNKSATIVGRLVNHGTLHPFALVLTHDRRGHIALDALLHTRDDLSTLFSFTRAYFLVDMVSPAACVQFLHSLLPHKPKAELYTAIGLHKQGKTLFYRDFLHHLAHSSDTFDLAPGIRGLVMTVFTLPSYPYVFKMIRDHIDKDGVDNVRVRRKYQLVKQHDRVGRMADTWEYSQVALPRARFSARLLDALREQVGQQIEILTDAVVLRHVYIERRMTPLNLYLSRATDAGLNHAIRQYGQAIRELAAANIFPGDMLYKNFGVTRLGRVVFYDYDEIQRMSEMNFRRIPPAPNEEAELSGEPWYPVGRNDVFPEEFRVFLLGDARVRRAFLAHHACLLDADWWQDTRSKAMQGHIEDRFPYDDSRRLCHFFSGVSHV